MVTENRPDEILDESMSIVKVSIFGARVTSA